MQRKWTATMGLFAGAFFAACLLALLFAGCGGDDDDNNAASGDLVWSLDFENPQDAKDAGATVVSKNPDAAFAPGFSGNAFWLSEGNVIIAPADGGIPPREGTLEFWVQPKRIWTDWATRSLFSIGDQANFSIVKDSDHNFLNFTVSGHALTFSQNLDLITYIAFTAYQPYSWTAGWTHVALVWKDLGERREGMRRIYVNGALKNEEIGQLPSFSVGDEMYIGSTVSNEQPDCLIDNLRVYNRAKGEKEIREDAWRRDLQMDEEMNIIPTPQAVGKRPGPGFTLTADTRIVVSNESAERMADLLAVLQDWVEKDIGARPEIVTPGEATDLQNVIVVGTPEDNAAVKRLGEMRKLPAREEDFGRDGYGLEVYENAVLAAAAEYPGSVYALTSFIRLVSQHHDGVIPPLTIIDRPDFKMRGTEMTGLSELNDEMKRRIRYMAELKLSHLVIPGDFYFDLDDAVIRAKVQEVFQYVRDCGLEPVPELPLYGDATRVIAECTKHGFDCSDNGKDTCPMVEAMYTQVYEPLLQNVADYLAPNFIHIGHGDIHSFNRNPVCAAAGLSPAELYAHSVNETVRLVRKIMPDTEIMIWADMILPMHNGNRLTKPAPGSDQAPPLVTTLVPHDITWCDYRYNNFDLLLYFYGFLSYNQMEADGYTYTVGSGGEGTSQALMWMRNAYAFNARGFIGRPTTDAGFADPLWDWLPAVEELAWSFWLPEDPADLSYDFHTLNASYGSM